MEILVGLFKRRGSISTRRKKALKGRGVRGGMVEEFPSLWLRRIVEEFPSME
ncbi:hypothetical protein GCM10027343_37180 [Noviherbaspirillum agri]